MLSGKTFNRISKASWEEGGILNKNIAASHLLLHLCAAGSSRPQWLEQELAQEPVMVSLDVNFIGSRINQKTCFLMGL